MNCFCSIESIEITKKGCVLVKIQKYFDNELESKIVLANYRISFNPSTDRKELESALSQFSFDQESRELRRVLELTVDLCWTQDLVKEYKAEVLQSTQLSEDENDDDTIEIPAHTD